MRALVVFLTACAAEPAAVTTTTHDRCDGVVVEEPIIASPHVPMGSPIEWPSNPPTSGPHYPIWPAYDRHYDDLERGYWLHAAEHGGIVLAYRCDDGCPDVAEELDAVVRAQPADPHCDAPVKHRAIVVDDPQLPDDHGVYAIAWGTYYAATCVDVDALAAFYQANTGRGSENTCVDGADFGGVAL